MRVYDVEGGAFSLKIAHLSFSMGLRGTRDYGLRPRLWLLLSIVLQSFLRVLTSYKAIKRIRLESSDVPHKRLLMLANSIC